MPRLPLRNNGRGAQDPGKTMTRLLSYLSPYRWTLVMVLICILVSSVATVAGSKSLEYVVDDYIRPLLDMEEADFGPLFRFLCGMAAIFAAGIVSAFFYNYLMVKVAQGVQRDIRDKLFSNMQQLPIRYFDTHTHGDIMSRYTNDIDTLRQMISQAIPQCIASVVTIVTVFVTMLVSSLTLTAVAVVALLAILVATKKLTGISGRFFVGQQDALGEVNGYIEEMINGQKVIKVFCHEEAANADFDKLNETLFRNAYRANMYSGMMGPVNNNLGYVQYALVAVVGAWLITQGGSLGVGALMSFLLLTRSLNQPISQVSNQVNAIVMAIAGAERIFDLMDEPPEEDHGYVTLVNAKRQADGSLAECPEHTGLWAWKHPHKAEGTVTYTELQGDITMFNVDFAYEPGKPVLHDVTLYAKPGQKVAFVGATGAGKTTITNLINRFYDIADGKIRYDNININKIKKPDLRRSLGMVLQDTNLFTGTVMDNIRYGNLEATDEQCIQAAKLANAHEFIVRLPQGYDTMLTGNGASLSQGQRQLLSIARAAVADPPVMILDEATSSIDTRTEALVQRGMDALMEGRTTFVIAHRLSTVRNADCIMVLDHGRIIERGTHQDLIAKKGTYYQLYTGAFELE